MYMNNVHENITVKQDDVTSLSVYVISAHIINIVSSIKFNTF